MSRSLVPIVVACLMAVPTVAVAQDKPAVLRGGHEWYLRDSLSGGPATTAFSYGRFDDGPPLLCDWNGDGTRTPGVVRAAAVDAGKRWFLRDSNSGGTADHAFYYGRGGDYTLCGDWDGDGRQTPGVVRIDHNGRFRWHLRNSLSGGPADVSFTYGRLLSPDPQPPYDTFTHVVTGDWNGDGRDTVGIVQSDASGRMRWLLRDSNTGGAADHDFDFGEEWLDVPSTTAPIVGDWNGDGRDGPGITNRRSRAGGLRWVLRNDPSGGEPDHDLFYGRWEDRPMIWR